MWFPTPLWPFLVLQILIKLLMEEQNCLKFQYLFIYLFIHLFICVSKINHSLMMGLEQH